MKKADEKYMRRAIELARKGEGRTSPNPIVGAVVVKNGRVVGEGYHKQAGDSHAEVVALKKAGAKARGADLYVTLEPCCHYGRTPPCSDLIIKSGVRRVIVGQRDPNPLVSGRGMEILKRRKISVTESVLKEECERINLPYSKWIVSGVPYVTLKVALSLDGKIATRSGDSKWITNESCRRYVHELRDKADAVLIGVGTALKDDPRLTVRLPNARGKSNVAVLLDEKLALPPATNLARRKKGKLIIATTSVAPKSKIEKFRKMGHEVLVCRATSAGRVFLPHLLSELGLMGIVSILVEGGGQVFSDFVRRRLADKIVACISPKIIGGEGRNFLPGLAIDAVDAAIGFHHIDMKVMGDNCVIEGFFSR